MTGWHLLGLALIALAFVGVFIVPTRTIGWRGTAGVFGISAAIVAVIVIGTALLVGDLP